MEIGIEQMTRVVVIAAAQGLDEARGIPTPSGCSGAWHPASVRRDLAYAEAA